MMKMYLHSLWTERDPETEIGVGEGGRKGEREKEKKVKKKSVLPFSAVVVKLTRVEQ